MEIWHCSNSHANSDERAYCYHCDERRAPATPPVLPPLSPAPTPTDMATLHINDYVRMRTGHSLAKEYLDRIRKEVSDVSCEYEKQIADLKKQLALKPSATPDPKDSTYEFVIINDCKYTGPGGRGYTLLADEYAVARRHKNTGVVECLSAILRTREKAEDWRDKYIQARKAYSSKNLFGISIESAVVTPPADEIPKPKEPEPSTKILDNGLIRGQSLGGWTISPAVIGGVMPANAGGYGGTTPCFIMPNGKMLATGLSHEKSVELWMDALKKWKNG